MPKVSVLMPIYKTNVIFLREAIESILAQTWTDFEFLIIDDCPSDTREYVVKSYKDTRIRYFKNARNLGIAATRNKLLHLAKGTYLAIFDHDDISLPTRLEKEVTFLDTHPDVGVVSGQIKFLPKNNISANPQYNVDIKIGLMHGCTLVHTCAMIRKSVLEKHHLCYEDRFSPSEDYRLWCRLIPYTKFYNIPDVLLFYRKYKTNASAVQKEKMESCTQEIRVSVQAENPYLYNIWKNNLTDTIRIKLFNFIPILKIVKTQNYIKFYLFCCLLLFTAKTSLKIKEVR